MGNVIEFLTRLGEDASLRHISDDALAALASEAGMSTAASQAVRSRDPEALRTLLGQGIYFATQMGEPLREDDEPSEDGEGDDDDEGESSPDDHHPTSHTPDSRH